ncbi:MAG: PilT/PilU family type 4a pilus ATPase [Planctomycetota bacterium]|nr:PilT/PilU family type 4a pilus ATPase [Planctomycetota bacterium]
MPSMQIDSLLETCIRQGASDLHLHVGRPPTLRLMGRLRPLKTKVLEPEDTMELMKAITPERAQQELQEQGGTDFGFEFGGGRFRTAVFHQKGNISLSLRLIPQKLLSFEQIGLPDIVKSLCRRPRGLFLVTGPTGSGKTTTMASMVDYINDNFDRHIITIEDPIEYFHQHKKSMVNQREVGVDVPSFSEALRRSLRMDPDVILVGELRDLETIEAALRAAETGHLVFGTLHTTNAQGTVTRIVDQFPVNQQEQIRIQLASVMIGVICQALIPRTDARGMVAAFEFMLVNNAIANLIRENKVFRIPSSIQTGKKYGMRLLDEHLLELYTKGIISGQDAIDRSQSPSEMMAKVQDVELPPEALE